MDTRAQARSAHKALQCGLARRMNDREFTDTDILTEADDAWDPRRHSQARE